MITSIRFLTKDDLVTLIVNERRVLSTGFKAALEFAKALDEHIRNSEERALDPTIATLPESSFGFGGVDFAWRQELDRIVCICAGRMLFDLPTAPADGGESIARRVWALWTQAAREVEEVANADRIAFDAAILHRAGAPFGLSNNPKIQAEAAKEADGHRDLRRFMRDRRSGHVLGAPTLRRSVIKPVERVLHLAKNLPTHSIDALRAALN